MVSQRRFLLNGKLGKVDQVSKPRSIMVGQASERAEAFTPGSN